MKVVLIRPPETNRIWVGIPRFFNDGIFLFPPLGIMQLKAHIEKNTAYDVIVYDCLIHKADYKKLGDFIKKEMPDVVGISTFKELLPMLGSPLATPRLGSGRRRSALAPFDYPPRPQVVLPGVFDEGQPELRPWVVGHQVPGPVDAVRGQCLNGLILFCPLTNNSGLLCLLSMVVSGIGRVILIRSMGSF